MLLTQSYHKNLISSVLGGLYSSRSCISRRTLPCAPVHSKRYSASTPGGDSDKTKSAAVLGGGITGLSTAWYLTRFAPGVPITVYEQSERLGGWLRSKQVEYEGGTVLFEQGPRTIRPWTIAGLVTIDMIRQLGLESELLIIPKTSPAAKNRFIYYPDRLNQLPGDIASVILSFRLPVMKGVFSGMIGEPFRRRRPTDIEDESVGSFLTRRFNKSLANNLASAVLHGIYAGDVDQLSAKSLFPGLWRSEEIHGSLMRGVFGKGEETLDDQVVRAELHKDNQGICSNMSSASVYTFKKGIETLSLALTKELEANPNVTIKTKFPIQGLSYTSGNPLPVKIMHLSTPPTHHSHTISTLSAASLASLLPTATPSPSLSAISAVTVLVVNLYFRTPSLHRVKGFGYLIPKSIPESANPHHALGVIFDSDTSPTTETGTKVTVMLGGHYWSSRSTYPDDEEAVRMATETLERHLRITEKPVLSNVTLQRGCIPQYHVGHNERLGRAHSDLMRSFRGRLSVAGSSFGGVGLNDCVRGARKVAKGVAEAMRGQSEEDRGLTGLELWSEGGIKWVSKTE
ncbi:uncharacterized protein LAJ45_00140 [Morchella importuna]|uniref:uncharacterized protein n=1 Tax=Morchella importuna TaxID=1174673 RepID=UPI001E8D3973|nr:uncharacterized protein LAJ45_00140 [Morchella importuna]KAH8155131.1 hypothetical protein LAJ45_00140 [Morchella importuna]